MQLKDYIQGDRKGKDANRLEREAMSDSFLQDALDGFDAVEGNHAQVIEQLERKLIRPVIVPHRNRKLFLYWSAAASILLLAGFSIYFFLEGNKNTTSIIAMNQPEVINDEITVDSSVLQSEQMEEPQQKMLAVAKKVTPPPPSPTIALEMDKVLDVSDADEMVVDEIVNVQSFESSVENVAARAEASERASVSQRKQLETAGSVSATGKSDSVQSPFGEKEFRIWCRQKANKDVCGGQGATVKLSFFVDETGKPDKIEYKKYSCEDVKNEMEKLLSSSPVWTKTKRKVTMTISWNE